MAKKRKPGSGQYPLRLPNDLRSRVEKASKDRNVSINAEILLRLERSFEMEDRFGGPQVVDLVETIATVMKTVGEHAMMYDDDLTSIDQLRDWLFQPYAFEQAKQAVNAVLEAYRPKGEIVAPTIFKRGRGSKRDPKAYAALNREVAENFGRLMAASELEKRKQDDE